MHIMYAGPYHIGFSGRSSKCWFRYVYWVVVGWVLSGEGHKRTLFGNVALILINQGYPVDYSCCLAAFRKAFLQSSVCVFAETRASARWAVWMCWWSRCWSTVWGALWPLVLHAAGGLQKPGGCVLLRVAHTLLCGWHAWYGTGHLKDGWLWATSASPSVWELSFRKIVRTLKHCLVSMAHLS